MSEVLVDGVRYLPVRGKSKKRRPLNELLAEARTAKDESLEKAASGMGTTKPHLWTMESGQCNPCLDLLQRMLDYYDIEYDEIAKVEAHDPRRSR